MKTTFVKGIAGSTPNTLGHFGQFADCKGEKKRKNWINQSMKTAWLVPMKWCDTSEKNRRKNFGGEKNRGLQRAREGMCLRGRKEKTPTTALFMKWTD